MLKEVLREKCVDNAILWSGLRLYHQPTWRKNKHPQELSQFSKRLHEVMQLHFNTEHLVVGVPSFGRKVILLELAETDFSPDCHQIDQVIESDEGHFVKISIPNS